MGSDKDLGIGVLNKEENSEWGLCKGWKEKALGEENLEGGYLYCLNGRQGATEVGRGRVRERDELST